MIPRIMDRDPAPFTGRWPVTGLWCSVCGWPMHQALEEWGGHPNCLEPPPEHLLKKRRA